MVAAIGDATTCPHGHPLVEGARENGARGSLMLSPAPRLRCCASRTRPRSSCTTSRRAACTPGWTASSRARAMTRSSSSRTHPLPPPPGQRGARCGCRLSAHRNRLGDAARHRVAAVVRDDDDLVIARALELAVQPGVQAALLEVVQELLGLVLEAQHRDLGAGLDVGEQHAVLACPLDERVAVRAGRRVADRREHALLEHGRHRVLESLGLLVDLVPRDPEDVGEEALDQAVATDDRLRVVTTSSVKPSDLSSARLT